MTMEDGCEGSAVKTAMCSADIMQFFAWQKTVRKTALPCDVEQVDDQEAVRVAASRA